MAKGQELTVTKESLKPAEIPAAKPAAPQDMAKPLEFQEEINKMVQGAGKLKLTPEQDQILFAPIKDDDVEIRPDGMIYLPWVEYSSRLSKAFKMEWALLPQGFPKTQGNFVIWPHYLVIKGFLMGVTMGECEYRPNNSAMSYGDAVEGATSNALTRLCKRIGINIEIWKPSFVRAWRAKNACWYWDQYSNGRQYKHWTRLDEAPEDKECFRVSGRVKLAEPVEEIEEPIKPQIDITPERQKNLPMWDEILNAGKDLSKLKEYGIEKAEDFLDLDESDAKRIHHSFMISAFLDNWPEIKAAFDADVGGIDSFNNLSDEKMEEIYQKYMS